MASELGFEAKSLQEEAQRRAAASDFGDPAFAEPLRRLLAALEREAELNPAGRLGQQERIVGLLVNRLRTEECVRRHPEILAERIGAPIVIVGLARTGTTMLHRMLASDPRLHALLWYESRQPAPPPDLPAGAPDPRIADAEREVEAMLGASPELIAAHPMDAHAPDEEIMLVEHSFLSTNPEAFCRIPSFAAWREGQDLTPGYDYLLRLLRLLQWQKRRRGEPGERWILKTPFHLGHMDVLFRTFPDARIVWPHREPAPVHPLAREPDPQPARAGERSRRSRRDRTRVERQDAARDRPLPGRARSSIRSASSICATRIWSRTRWRRRPASTPSPGSRSTTRWRSGCAAGPWRTPATSGRSTATRRSASASTRRACAATSRATASASLS